MNGIPQAQDFIDETDEIYQRVLEVISKRKMSYGPCNHISELHIRNAMNTSIINYVLIIYFEIGGLLMVSHKLFGCFHILK